MIGSLRGTLTEKAAPALMLEVMGVGYEIEAPMSTFYQLPKLGDEVTLHTHLAVREDAHTLYGFASKTERLMFRTLIKINGVGAKLALTILSGVSVSEFSQIIESRDSSALVRLPGIGKKTAERLLVELSGRLPELPVGNPTAGATHPVMAASSPKEDAISALIALGYKAQDARQRVRSVSDANATSSEDFIRLALKSAT